MIGASFGICLPLSITMLVVSRKVMVKKTITRRIFKRNGHSSCSHKIPMRTSCSNKIPIRTTYMNRRFHIKVKIGQISMIVFVSML